MNMNNPDNARGGARYADSMPAERQPAEAARVEDGRVARAEPAARVVDPDQLAENSWNAPVDRTGEERRAAAEESAASEREKRKAGDELSRRAGKMTRLFEQFQNQESTPGMENMNKPGMMELASKWKEFSDDCIAYTTRQQEQMNQESMLRIAQQFRSAALVLSDASQSGQNLRANLVYKRDTNQMSPSNKPGNWTYYLQCRQELIGNLRDLAAYYERRANTGQDVFVRSPDRVAAPTAPPYMPTATAEDPTVGNQACDDVCGQIVHEIMSNLAR